MKIVKLFLVAIVVAGIVGGLIWWQNIEEPVNEPEYTSETANEIKESIKALCRDSKWSSEGYSGIESRIHMDSLNYNIDMMEASSLRMYLYSSSCSYLKEGVNKLFQSESYSGSKISYFENALNYLSEKISEQGSNSNLTEVAKMFSAYRQLMSALTYGTRASYSRPLKAYSGGSADGRKQRIQAIPYYKSHFSKNSSIRAKVDRIESDIRAAEMKYYESLEKLVENHYKQTGRIDELLEDQIRFNEITTNNSAKSRLNNFVNNPNN